MLCQNCKTNAATIFYKETAGGRTTEYSLCPACAAKLQIGMPFGGITEDDPLTSLFAGMLGHSRAVREEKRCPVCGALTEKKVHCDQPGVLEKGLRWVDNDMVNFLNNVSGAVLALVIWTVI